MAYKSMYKNEIARAAGVSIGTFRAWLPNLFFVFLLLQEDLFLTLNLVAQLLFSGQESQVLSCIELLAVVQDGIVCNILARFCTE